MKTVSRLSVAPVKGMALVHPDEISLEPFGVAANRRFFVVDEDGRRYGQIRDGTLVRIQPSYDETSGRLTLRFPDGTVVDGVPQLGETVVTDFYGRPVRGRVVDGEWSDAISRFVGRPLRLVRCDEPGAGVDRDLGTVTMLSDASLDELARQAHVDGVDARRFRMLIGIAGCEPHEEDSWLGGRVRVGTAVVRLHEQVGRCAITTQNPDSGVPDLDTLREIKRYRGMRDKDIDFGVFGEVEAPGRVRVGDAIEPLP
ncbi:MAG: MOSC domain-containing protein [Gaiellaceae bacterium]